MTTQLQTRANKANALKSTGPKSEAGRMAVRLNATRHGLLSRAPIMAGEDADEYTALCAKLADELQPRGIIEEQLTARIAGALWRLRRAAHIEAGLFTHHAARAYAEAAEDVAKSHTVTTGGMDEIIAALDESTVTVVNEDAHESALQIAEDARQTQLSESALMGAAYEADAGGADALTKLSRYETTIERGLYRAHDELQRLQQNRNAAQNI